MKDKKMYILLVISILFAVVGVSLAFFSLSIIGNDKAKNTKITTGDLELVFTDDNEVSLDGAFPGDSITKTISVKNTGTKEVSYNIVWQELLNEITNNELVIDGTCKNLNPSNIEDGTCSAISKKAVKEGNITSNIPIKPGYTQEYTIKITFIDTGKLQNYNKNKLFKGKLGLTESSAKTVYCTYDGELTQGAEYVNGQYTYRYMQEGYNSTSTENTWINIEENGWGVQLTDKESVEEVNNQLCTYINENPVISMSEMFKNSKTTLINLNNFNTSNVVNMKRMFSESNASTILGLDSFNTSKVTNMDSMFQISQVAKIDLSSFDTSHVSNMNQMFEGSSVKKLDLSNFITSNVTNMASMFNGSQVSTLNLSNFDTANVVSMSALFRNTQLTILDLNSFNTSNVTNMAHMFLLSNNLKTIYVGNKFNTAKVNDSSSMFRNCTNLIGGAGTKYDANHTDKEYAHIDGGTSNPGYFTDIADKPSTFETDDWATIVSSVRAGNTRGYKVGETKEVNLGTTYGTHTLRVANTSTPSECSGTGFSQTACGFVLEFVDIIITHNMNPNGEYKGKTYNYGWNEDGWPASSMRTFVNNDIYNALPSEIKSTIIDTTVVSGHGSEDSSNFTSTDKLYLLAPKEIYTDFNDSYDTAKDLTRTLDYYTGIGVTTSNSSGAIKKNGTSAFMWWLRAAYSNSDDSFYSVDANGGWGNNVASNTFGVSPVFRIG